jgi:hypothetical protein
LSRHCPYIVPASSRHRPGIVPASSRHCPGIVPALSRHCPGIVPALSRHCPYIVPVSSLNQSSNIQRTQFRLRIIFHYISILSYAIHTHHRRRTQRAF